MLPQMERELHAALDAFRTANGFGRGISAPQIGYPVRMIALNLGATAAHRPKEQPLTLINPSITWRSGEMFTMWDDCMSIPDKMVRLSRHTSVSLRYLTSSGEQYDWERLGRSEAELVQHELDHLDGILAVDRATGVVSRHEYLAARETYDGQVDYAIESTIG
jgi:peptide deformylase